MSNSELKYVDEMPMDDLTDEEKDEYYRIQKPCNDRKSLAPLFIYLILEEFTSEKTRFNKEDLIYLLESQYDIKIDKKSVTRIINTLTNDDLGIVATRTGLYLKTEW